MGSPLVIFSSNLAIVNGSVLGRDRTGLMQLGFDLRRRMHPPQRRALFIMLGPGRRLYWIQAHVIQARQRKRLSRDKLLKKLLSTGSAQLRRLSNFAACNINPSLVRCPNPTQRDPEAHSCLFDWSVDWPVDCIIIARRGY